MAIVFTYGSLMCDDIMAAVTGQALASESASLNDFARYAVRNEAYPAIVPEASAKVQGRVYYDVNELVLARLDLFEGDWYSRVALEVEVQGTLVEAQTYVFRDECRQQLADWLWDFEFFLQHGKHIFTAEYLGYQRLG